MDNPIDTLLSYLESGQEMVDLSDGDAEDAPVEPASIENEFITASKLLIKQEKNDETSNGEPIGPDIFELFGDFDDDDDSWLNGVDGNTETEKSTNSVDPDEPIVKGFSIGSSVGQGKINPSKSRDKDGSQNGGKKSTDDGSIVSFGSIRIKDLLFEPHEIERRIKSATMITLSQIPWKIKTNSNREVGFDWVTFAVIVSKEMKTSTKNGSSYTLMKLSDLKDVSKHVSLFLFSECHANHWKLQPSSVIGLLNPKIMPPNQDVRKRGDEICSLTLNHPGHLVHVGTSVDLGYCKSGKKNGDICNAVINKKDCSTCIFHIQSEYKKMTSKRPELKLSYSGIIPKSRKESANYGSESHDRDQEMDGKHIALIGPVNVSSFNHAIKRALTDPSSDVSTTIKSSSRSKEVGSRDDSSANNSVPKRARIEGSSDESGKDSTRKKVRMTKEEWEAEKKRRQELIDSYQLRRRMEAEMIEEALKAPLTLAAKNLKAAMMDPQSSSKAKSGSCLKAKIEGSKGQRISLSGASNAADIFKHLKPVEVTSAPAPKLGRGLKPGEEVTISLTKNRDVHPRSKANAASSGRKMSMEDERKLRHNLMMAKRKAAAAKVLAVANDPEEEKRKKLEALKKRVAQNLEGEDEVESKEAKLAKIKEAINRKSKHVKEVEEVEAKDEELYFSRLERKEALEEKMASTTCMKVKGVVCPTCKYIAESQSEYCIKNNHQVVRKEVIKRFLACKSCNNRVVSYNSFLPNRSCPKCKGNEFKTSSLRPTKVIEKLEPLLIRGEECSFLNSIN